MPHECGHLQPNLMFLKFLTALFCPTASRLRFAAERQIRGAGGRRIFKIIDTLGSNWSAWRNSPTLACAGSVLAPIEGKHHTLPTVRTFRSA
jgi:hypothetical protein